MQSPEKLNETDCEATDVVTLEELVNAACPEHNWQCSRERNSGDQAESVFVCRSCAARPGHTDPVSIPIVVCQACAEACHAEHETFLLGNRHGLQCQCSPPLCSLSEATGAEVSDSQLQWLREHHNARNRFCVCDAEYTGERDGTMYQCIGCEDWFHWRCLRSLAQTEPATGELLVCGACMDGESALAQWAHAATSKGLQSEPLCLANASPSATSGTRAAQSGPVLIHMDQLGNTVCPCDACTPLRKQAHLDWIVEDGNAPENTAPTESSPFPPSIQGNRVLELEYALTWRAAKERLYTLFQECAQENRVVTERDVRLALADIQREIGQSR
jgi:hypothetical protein